MKQNELKSALGTKHKRKRVGRGNSSGHGTYSGRGCKGQKSRSGYRIRPGFEGGQLPLIKRLSQKRGFINPFKTVYETVNVNRLNIFPPDSEVTPEELMKKRLIKSLKWPVKILGGGNLGHSLSVVANKFSNSAERKIIAAGGKVKRL